MGIDLGHMWVLRFHKRVCTLHGGNQKRLGVGGATEYRNNRSFAYVLQPIL